MNIATLTVNPALDKSATTDLILPAIKIRCSSPRFEPGGGGVNVSRALQKMGKESTAIYIAGGHAGNMMHQLLDEEGVNQLKIDSDIETRENFLVMEENTGQQYRFGMPGKEVPEEKWREALKKIETLEPVPDYLVASGSLPPGVPKDFYAQVAETCKKRNIKIVVDTSGEPLKLALEAGIYLAKPNFRELAKVMDQPDISEMELEKHVNRFIQKDKCEALIISMGAKGVILATHEFTEYIIPPHVSVVSSVGAGDSMVAGILYGLTNGYKLTGAARYGVAAGTAAAMTPGSELCRKNDVERIFQWLSPDLE
jgi:6-phosphofructokinase 2